MKRMMAAAMLGALALVGCYTERTIMYSTPANGPTATVSVTRQFLDQNENVRLFIAAPGGEMRAQLGDMTEYEYRKPFVIAAGDRTVFEVELTTLADTLDSAISHYYSFTPAPNGTYVFQPDYSTGVDEQGRIITGPPIVIDAVSGKPPGDFRLELLGP